MAAKAAGATCSADKECVPIPPVFRIEIQYPVDVIRITA